MIKILAKSKDEAEVLVHEAIGDNWFGDGLTSKRFAEDLKKIGDVKSIRVRINSPGGSVTDGVGIYNALRSHGARIVVDIEGAAYSIASVIAMAGDEIRMRTGSMMMIHSPWSFAMGNAEEMREAADVLDKFEDSLLDIYVKRSGRDRAELKDMLRAETWLHPAEAVEAGLADVADDTEEPEQKDAAAALLKQQRAEFRAFAMTLRKPMNPPPALNATASTSAPAESKETTMTEEEKRAAEAAAQAKADAAVKAAREANAQRQAAIRQAFSPFAGQHSDLLIEFLADENITAEAASQKLLAAVAAKQAGPLGTTVLPGADSRDKFLAGAEKALLARAGIEKKEAGNEFNGMSLVDIAAHCLGRDGISVKGMTKDEIARKVLGASRSLRLVQGSHTTGDFPLLLANTAGKVLRGAFALAPVTWNRIAKKGSVSDFKAASRHTLGSFSSLLLKPERGEYKQGTLSEERETITAATKGRYISLSREMIVNDDLGGFTDMSRKMGRAAARTVEADFYTLLTSASGAGPTMSDTGAFFNATAIATAGGHANLTSSGTAISVTSIAAAEAMMMAQKDKSLNDFVVIQPRVLLCSPAKKQIAWEVVNSLTDVASSNANKKNYVQAQMNLEVVASPYLSGNPWYLFADPADVEAFEVAFLDGNDSPFIDEEVEFMTDALNMKVRLDYGIAAIDWRAGYRNAGA